MDLTSYRLYNEPVTRLSVGDVIRKARDDRGWSQTRLGQEAERFQLQRASPINPNTISKIERDPYTSEFGTVWRLLAALGLTLADAERQIGSPFLKQETATPSERVSELGTTDGLARLAQALDAVPVSQRTEAVERAVALLHTPAARLQTRAPKRKTGIPAKATKTHRGKKSA